MTTLPLSPADFAPMGDRTAPTVVVPPSLPYWRDAWLRLKQDHRAIASLWMVIALLIFTLFGPVLWRTDPAAQDLTQISLGPTLGRKAMLVSGQQSAPPTGHATAFQAVVTPNTEGVSLEWPMVAQAQGYRLFRHRYPPSGPLDLGLPLITLEHSQTEYRDKLRLEATDYYYTLWVDAPGMKQPAYQTIEVTPIRAVTVQQARNAGLAADHDARGLVTLRSHPMGTDYLGRDILARLMQGARTSLFIGIVAPAIFTLIGIFYGGLAGFRGGRIDREMMRIADFVLGLPFLLFMILFNVMFGLGAGESGIFAMLIALIVLSWPAPARLVRAQVLQSRGLAYIEAAQLMGAGTRYLVTRHMLPNLLSVVLVSLTFSIPTAIFTEAFLSFIGMGVVPPTPSWGSMCNDGLRNFLWHPHELIFPALFISVTVLAFNLLGDGLRDSLDVKLRFSR